jgi:outer membrane protein insertion porin family
LSIGRRFLAPALLVLAALRPAAALAQADSLYGRTVVSVSYSSNGPVDRSDVERLVTIRVGFPLTDTETGQTIRNLFATRQFADVQVEATPADGGVAVRILLFRLFRVRALRFSGHRGLSRDELGRVLPFFVGSVYSAAEVEEGAAVIERRLLAEGFPRAVVQPQTIFDTLRFEARVAYRIESGARARVGPAIFLGPIEPFTAAELLSHARLKPGDRYREAKAVADATRMREFLHREGRLKASIELIAAQPAENERILPVYRASVGPEVVFETVGVKASKVQRQIHGMLEGQVLDEDLILQYTEQKQQELQQDGYFRAKVSYSFEQQPDRITVKIDAAEGPKFSVERVVFEGNASVSDKTLRGLLVTAPKGLPLLAPGRLTDKDLKGDVDAVLGYYQSGGWIDAKVGPAEVADGSKPGRLIVRIPIVEGPKTVVASRTVEGAEHADAEQLDKILAVKVGRPFNPNLLRQDVFAIQGYYQNRGWLEASVREDYQLSSDRASAEVTYRVEEGVRSFFGKTIVRGNTTTQTNRIRRLLPWSEGAPFSEEKILEAQRQLSRTGAFRRVDVRPEATDPSLRERNVQVDVQEAKPLSLLYGFGYQYLPEAAENQNDPFVVGGVSTRNLFGGMRSAGLEASVALSGRYRVQASYRDPFLFGFGWPFTSVVFAGIETIQTVDLERVGFVNEVWHEFAPHLRGSFRAEYQRSRPTNPENLSFIDISTFSRLDQPIEEAALGTAFFYDRRDDPIDPHHGYYASVAGKYAFPFLTAQAKFTKFATQAVYFLPIGKAVLAVSGRVGGIFPYGGTSIPSSQLEELLVPTAERFFVGGRSTERAFEADLLGIPGSLGLPGAVNATVDYTTLASNQGVTPGQGTCAPTFERSSDYNCTPGPRIIGGNGFISINAELRIPIWGNLGGTVFYDAAQVWKDFSSINLHMEGEDGLRQGVGVGLFYMLPIGPLRAEYAWKVTRRVIPFAIADVTGCTAESGCSNPPILGYSSTRESAGQFFVSIGFPF